MNDRLVAPEDVGMSAKRLDRIRPAMQRFIDDGSIAGLITMIARRGALVHFEPTGRMDLESGEHMRGDAIFRIYSMTKPVVCTALMTLFEEGRFLLTDPVSKFIPGFRDLRVLGSSGSLHEMSAEPTIHQLLTHTAGLTYDFLDDSPVCALYREARLLNDTGRSLEELIRELLRLPLAFDPGTRWHYSVAIDVAAHLLQIIADEPLADVLAERLFDPLGMTDTGFFVRAAERDRVPTMYGIRDIAGRDMSPSKAEELNPDGVTLRIDVAETHPVNNTSTFARGGHGLFSTAEDYMRFARMLLGGGRLGGQRILSRKTTELMHTNHLSADFLPMEVGGMPISGYGYGLGSRVLLDVAASGLPGSVGEFGWAGAARTHYWVDPQEEMVGILMTQYLGGTAPLAPTFQVLAYQAVID